VSAALALVRDIRDAREDVSEADIEAFEVDVLAEFVLARASAGLADSTIRGDIGHLERIREWFERPLWLMRPPDADRYFGTVLRAAASGTRLARAQALTTYFAFLEMRHQARLHALTGVVVACPLDEINRPRGSKDAKLRIPPSEAEVEALFAGWGRELLTCRKFAPAARNYAAAHLMAVTGLRVNEARCLDLADVRWTLGHFGKLHVRYGKGSRGSGPRERMVPLLGSSRATLAWYVEEVWGQFGLDHTAPGAVLFPSERDGRGTGRPRVGYDALRSGLETAVAANLPSWTGRMTPHVLRHYCASQLYLTGVDLVSVQEMLGHRWVATTMRYVHVHRSRIEEAWIAGQARAAKRLEGAAR
jgi:site-specific recombinase XerD